MREKARILITVKTYPLPSEKHRELVCTAGVREDGSFVRLYPIDYRYRPYWQWYQKYQWIEVDIEKNTQDPRPESFRPVGDIVPVGEPICTKRNWAERREYVLARGASTMCELESRAQSEVSLGIVKPRSVEDLVVEEVEQDWKPQWISALRQQRLFGPGNKPLEKIPYRFSYKYKCTDPTCKGHAQMIEDWEIGQLWRSMRDKYRDRLVACDKVRQKFFGEICAPDKDTHFFVGTILQHGTWIILGTFWPKKET